MRDHLDFDWIDEHGPQHESGTVALSAAELERDEVAGLGDVTIDVTAEKGEQPGEYVAQGHVDFTIDLICARCLDPYPVASRSDFAVRFLPRPADFAEGEEIEVDDAGLDVEYYADRRVPLAALAAEQIQLSMPMKPLCDETCQGLCPQCGGNRNQKGCTCEEVIGDDRWDGLRAIREQLARKKEV